MIYSMLVGNDMKFNIIDIKTHEIISKLNIDSDIKNIYCMNKGIDCTILCSLQYINKISIIKYRNEKGNLVKIFEKENPHGENNPWTSFIEFNKGIYATGGLDKLIILWKF